MELTGGLGADVAIEAVGVPATFELAAELIRPGGHVANIGVHGQPADAAPGDAVDPQRHHHDRAGRHAHHPEADEARRRWPAGPDAFATHRFALDDTMAAYDTFADAANVS